MACAEFVRECFRKTLVGHDRTVLSNLEVLDARPGYVLCKLPIKEHNLNSMGSTHGGCVMSMVDSVPWLAMASLGFPESDSVSTNMSCEFVRPCGKLGDDLYIEGIAVKQGRTLAFTRVTFKVHDQICAFGSHTLAVGPNNWTHKFTPDGKHLVPIGEENTKAKL